MFFSKNVCVNAFLRFVNGCNYLKSKGLDDLRETRSESENGCQLATVGVVENRQIMADLVMRILSKKI
jgi:hypothetical protein